MFKNIKIKNRNFLFLKPPSEVVQFQIHNPATCMTMNNAVVEINAVVDISDIEEVDTDGSLFGILGGMGACCEKSICFSQSCLIYCFSSNNLSNNPLFSAQSHISFNYITKLSVINEF